MRKAKPIYSNPAVARKSVNITDILAETKDRQDSGKAYDYNGKMGSFRYVLMVGFWHGEAIERLTIRRAPCGAKHIWFCPDGSK